MNDRNLMTLRLYVENRALCGMLLSPEEREDQQLRRAFATIDTELRKYERGQIAESLDLALSRLKVK